jgi:hypothetical protein
MNTKTIATKFNGLVFNIPADEPWALAPSTIALPHRQYSRQRHEAILKLQKIEVKCSNIIFLDLDANTLHLTFDLCNGIEGEYRVLKLEDHPKKEQGFLFEYESTGGHKRGDSPYEPGGSFMMAIEDKPIWVDTVKKELILFAYTVKKYHEQSKEHTL